MGVLHADQRGRDSLALDLMEPVRPMRRRAGARSARAPGLRRQGLLRDGRGNCRLMPGITTPLAEHAPTLARWVRPSCRAGGQSVRQGECVRRASPRADRDATHADESERRKRRAPQPPPTGRRGKGIAVPGRLLHLRFSVERLPLGCTATGACRRHRRGRRSPCRPLDLRPSPRCGPRALTRATAARPRQSGRRLWFVEIGRTTPGTRLSTQSSPGSTFPGTFSLRSSRCRSVSWRGPRGCR